MLMALFLDRNTLEANHIEEKALLRDLGGKGHLPSENLENGPGQHWNWTPWNSGPNAL